MGILRGSYFIFQGSILHLEGEITPEPPCIFSLLLHVWLPADSTPCMAWHTRGRVNHCLKIASNMMARSAPPPPSHHLFFNSKSQQELNHYTPHSIIPISRDQCTTMLPHKSSHYKITWNTHWTNNALLHVYNSHVQELLSIIYFLSNEEILLTLRKACSLSFMANMNQCFQKVKSWQFCPTLTKGSKWQITQIWDVDVYRLVSMFCFQSEFSAETLICWKMY